MAISFNVTPYYDDFLTAGADGLSPKEKYQRILFRPGKAVQARELTQLQTALQHQISSQGDHLFKDGSVVVPGAVHLHNKIDYVKLDSVSSQADTVAELVGTEFSDGTNKAKVIHAALATGSDPITLWVQYTSGTVFADNASLTATGSKTAEVKASSATGFGSLVSIEDGIYYIKKHMVVAKAKTIVLSKYTSSVSFDIGLLVTEALVSSGSDASLNDNAAGTPNASAPGAHRYSITAVLSTQAVNATSGNFVLIARLESGVITKNANSADYNVLADTLARRTFDESGNYYVNPFKALIKTHQAASPDATKLTVAIEPSKAYVRGYEIQTLATTNVAFDKARTSELVTDKLTEITHNAFIECTSMTGVPDITTFGKISIENNAGGEIGTCRVRSIERVSGNGASTASRYRLHIFDFTGTMTAARTLDDKEGTASGTTFTATIADLPSDVAVGPAATAYNLGSDSLVYDLPYERVKSCDSVVDESATDDYNYRYEINRIFTAATVSGSGTATFTAASANEQFGSKGANTNWILINDTDSTVGGEEVVVADITINNSANPPSVVIANLPSSANGDSVRLIAPIIKTAIHKTKTLSSNTSVAFNAGVTWTGTGQALGHADIYEIVSIVETSGSADVTTHFYCDKGQTDTKYGLGRVNLKTTSNYTAAVALTVTYKYFSHSAGDFFTVDSYTGQVDYSLIPSTPDGQELRSAVDFRPRESNAGGNFTGTGAQTAFAPRRFSQFETDIQFYLPRMDKVFLDSSGKFGVVKGVPARMPEASHCPSDSMHLYTLSIPAYTLTTAEVGVEFIDQRRYTMRDIGRLDTRIGQVEYYTALNFLETEAQNRQILDASNNPRWKAGYLVDGFANTRMSKSWSPEYRASVDIPNRTLRPGFSQGNAAMLHHASSSTQKTGDLVTLPYSTTPIISQTQYSGQINVNPYNVFNWTGSMALSPSTDEWIDIDRRPQVTINNDGEFDAMVNALQPQLGTVWGGWKTHWAGGGGHWETTYTPGKMEGPRNSYRGRGSFSRNWVAGNRYRAGKTRSGIQTTIAVETSRVSQGDRVVEVNFVPFMRTRLVHFSATRMKPATTVFAFFDGTAVAAFVNEAQPGYTPLVGPNTQTAHPSGAGALTTDANGAITGSFLIPNNSALNFTCGTKEFKLTSSSANNDAITHTSAFADYTAAGMIESREEVILSTRTPRLQRQTVDSGVVSWSDPLAQSVLLDKAAFISGIDIYFTSKDAAIPVQLQIRRMVNGFPTQEVLPFSDVTLNPGSVNIDGTATSFTFPSPVYLQDKVEFAFVLLANSNNYVVRYAEIGGEDASGNRISSQPYNGVLFMSQNASTWTADQTKDLMFVMKRCVFDISATRTAVLRNDALGPRSLVSNPLTCLATASDAASIIKVAHRDHGMKAGDSTTFAGFTATQGITAAELNKAHTITEATTDDYTITIAAAAHSSAITAGNGGGTAATALQNLNWNTMLPVIQNIVLPDTAQTWTVNTSPKSSGSISGTADAVTANDNFTPLLPQVIKSGSTHTIQLNGSFSSTNNYLSPVIDMERSSVIAIANRIDNNTGLIDATDHSGLTVVAETDKDAGTSLAKYVTKTVELSVSSDQIKVYVDLNRPNGTFIDVYYKTGNTLTTFDAQPWVLQTNVLTNVAFSDGSSYEETEYTIDPTDTFTNFAIKIVMRSTGTSFVPKIQQLRAIAVQV